jgi:adenosine deaminase
MGLVPSLEEYPLRALVDAGVKTTLTASTPARAGKSTTEQYLAAATSCGLTADDLDKMVVNAVHASGLEDTQKTTLLGEIRAEAAKLRDEHLK